MAQTYIASSLFFTSMAQFQKTNLLVGGLNQAVIAQKLPAAAAELD